MRETIESATAHYRSGDIQINKQLGNYSEYQSSAVIFNGNVNLMTAWGVAGRSIQLTQTTYPLSKFISPNPADPAEPINAASLKDPANWASTNLNVNCAPAKPSLAVSPYNEPDTLFSFYYEAKYAGVIGGEFLSPLYAIRFPLKDDDINKNNQWSSKITLFDSDGENCPTPSDIRMDINSTSIGDNMVIVTCASASPQPPGTPSSKGIGTFVGVYDKTKIDFENNKWIAEQSIYIPYDARISNPNRVLVEWYTTIGPQTDAKGNLLPGQSLLVLAMQDEKVNAWVSPIIPGNDNATAPLQGFTPLWNDPSPISFDATFTPPPPTGFQLADLSRDIAGRLKCRLYWKDTKQSLACNVYAPRTQDQNQLLSFLPTGDIVHFSEVNNAASPSSSVSYVAIEGQYATQVPPPAPSFPGQPDLKAVNYPVYEFIFYGEYPKCQVNRIGTVQTVTDPDNAQRTVRQKPDQQLYIIGGIFNGPIPYPLINYEEGDPGSSEVNAGTITYGTTKSDIKGRKTKRSLTYGLDEEAKFTKGIGPAYKLSFESGMGTSQEVTDKIDIVQNLAQDARVTYDDNKKNPRADSQGAIKVMTVLMQITAYNYIDFYGLSVSSMEKNPAETTTGAIQAGAIQIGFDDSGDHLFYETYGVTPGDLASYNPYSINEQMNKLGYNGKDLGYTGDNNYFGDVICQNALPIGDKNYLEMSWSDAGTSTPGFSETTSLFKETDWSFDASLYAGVSGGGGFELAGIGEEVESSVLFGADYSRETSISNETESEWGIEISEKWGPPVSESGVTKYVVRIYFLPVPAAPSKLPPTYWTKELLAHIADDAAIKKQIDPNSACWRIFYAVTEIEYVDSSKNWSYDRGLDKQSVYESNESN